MAVYVDDMRAPYGRLIMCHMIADTEDELHAMADKIGVARRWYQRTMNPHYDICLSKRALAVAAGAVQIEVKQSALMCAERRKTGKLGSAKDAADYLAKHRARIAARSQD